MRTPHGLAAAVVLAFVLAPNNSARATNGTWNNTASGGLWSVAGNWLGGAPSNIANGTDGIADFGTLDITADDTVHLDSTRTIGQLKFGDTSPSNNWILDNNGNVGDILTLAVTSGSPTITVVNQTATISAVLAGNQGLTDAGSGTLVLSASNTFTGGLTVNQGVLQISSINNANVNGSLGNNLNVTLGSGTSFATLDYTGASATSNMPFALSGASGRFQVDNVAANLTLSGTISGAAALVKLGPGTLALGGNNSFTGGLTVQTGTLQIGAINNANSSGPLGNNSGVTLGAMGQTGTLEYAGGSATSNMPFTLAAGGNGAFQVDFANLSLSGTISGAGGLTMGGQTLILSGNNTFTGGVTINTGTLQLGSAGALNSSTPNAVAFGSGSTGSMVLSGNSVTIGSLSTNAIVGTPIVQNQSATAIPATLTIGNGGGLTYAGVLQDGIGGGPLSLVLNTGTLTLSGSSANTFTGPVTVNDGGLILSKSSSNVQVIGPTLNIGDGIGPALSATVTVTGVSQFPAGNGPNVTIKPDGLLVFASGSNDRIGGLTMTGGGVTDSGSGSYSLLGDVVTLASATTATLSGVQAFITNGQPRTFTVAQGMTANGIDLDVPVPLANSGSIGPLVKAGAGVMRLSGNNNGTFALSGGVTLNAGTLIVGNNNALGSGTLTLAGGTLQPDMSPHLAEQCHRCRRRSVHSCRPAELDILRTNLWERLVDYERHRDSGALWKQLVLRDVDRRGGHISAQRRHVAGDGRQPGVIRL